MAEFINFVSVIILLISLIVVMVNGGMSLFSFFTKCWLTFHSYLQHAFICVVYIAGFEGYCISDSECESYCSDPKYAMCLVNKCICDYT